MALLLNQLSGFGILTFAKESRALIDAMTVAPNMARRRLIDLTVRAFLGAALWPKIDVMWFLAAHDEQAGRLNWKDPATFTLTAVNSPTFTADRGFAGNGSTSYLDTGWDPSNNGVTWQQNDALIFLYMRANDTTNIGAFGSTTNFASTVRHNGARVNGGSEVTGGNGTQPHSAFGRRIASTTVTVGRDGVETGTAARTSSTLSTVDFAIGRTGNTYYSSNQNAGASAGGYLDDTQVLAFHNIWRSYMRAVGADT